MSRSGRLQRNRGELIGTGGQCVHGDAQTRIEHPPQIGAILVYDRDGSGSTQVKNDDGLWIFSDGGHRLGNQVAAQLPGIVSSDIQAGFDA